MMLTIIIIIVMILITIHDGHDAHCGDDADDSDDSRTGAADMLSTGANPRNPVSVQTPFNSRLSADDDTPTIRKLRLGKVKISKVLFSRRIYMDTFNV